MQLIDLNNEIKSELKYTSVTPALDTQVLIAHVINKTRSWVVAHPEYELSSAQIAELRRLSAKLKSGVALPYIISHWPFFNLDFIVTPHVLIPRSETELLVELAIDWLTINPSRRTGIDIGTGSGCIAISLLSRFSDMSMYASDLSYDALCVAYQNAVKHGVSNQIHLVQASLFPPLETRFDLICANLPYIPSQLLQSLDVYHKEPTVALDGGVDGLDHITSLLGSVEFFLKPGGLLLCEIEASQGEKSLSLAHKILPNMSIKLMPDLAGKDRIIVIENKKIAQEL